MTTAPTLSSATATSSSLKPACSQARNYDPLLLNLSTSFFTGMSVCSPQVCASLSEAVMYIAKSEFPQRWPNLLPELFAQLQVQRMALRALCNMVGPLSNALCRPARAALAARSSCRPCTWCSSGSAPPPTPRKLSVQPIQLFLTRLQIPPRGAK